MRHAGSRTILDWQAPPSGATRVSYRVYRSRKLICHYHETGSRDCLLRMPSVVTTPKTTWADTRPGRWIYRVAMVADERRGRVGGSLLLFSPTVR